MPIASFGVITARLPCVREHHVPWLTQHRTGMTTIYTPVNRGHILLVVLSKRKCRCETKDQKRIT